MELYVRKGNTVIRENSYRPDGFRSIIEKIRDPKGNASKVEHIFVDPSGKVVHTSPKFP